MVRVRVLLALVMFALGVGGAVPARAVHQPPQPALAAEFVLGQTRAALPARCAAEAVARRVARMLGSFNAGRPYYFLAALARAPHFNPYNGTAEAVRAIAPQAVAAFVRARHRAGDGWTALALHPPVALHSRGEGVEAIYGLRLRVVKHPGAPYIQGAKVVVDCRTGRITTWVGPAAPPPQPR